MKSKVKSKPEIDPNSPRIQDMLSEAYDYFLKKDRQAEFKVIKKLSNICPVAILQYIPLKKGKKPDNDTIKDVPESKLEQTLVEALQEINEPLIRHCVKQLTGKYFDESRKGKRHFKIETGKNSGLFNAQNWTSPFIMMVNGLHFFYYRQHYETAYCLLRGAQSVYQPICAMQHIIVCCLLINKWAKAHYLLYSTRDDESLPSKHRAQAAYWLSYPYLRFGANDSAIKLLLQSVELNPNYHGSRIALMKEYVLTGKNKEALEQLEACQRLDPKTDAWKHFMPIISHDKFSSPEVIELIEGIQFHDKDILTIQSEIEKVDVSKGAPNREKAIDALRSFQAEHGQISFPVITDAMEAYLSPEAARCIMESSANNKIISIAPGKGAALVLRNGALTLNDQLKAYAVQVHQNALQNPFQVASLYKSIQEQGGKPLREIADLIGTNKDTVNNHLAFFDLPVEVQKFVLGTSKGRSNKEQPNWIDISPSFWRLLKKRAEMSDPPDVKGALTMAQMIITEDWSVIKCKQDISDTDEEARRAKQKKDFNDHIDDKSDSFTITKSGYTHRFLYMDSTKINSTVIPDESVDMIVTSPPYLLKGMAYEKEHQVKNIDEWWSNIIRPVLDVCIRVLKPGGMMVINLADANSYAQAIINGKKHGIVEEYLVMPPVFNYLREHDIYLHARIIWERRASQVQRKRSTFSVKKHAHGTYKVIANWEYLFCYRKGKKIRKRRDDHAERINILRKDRRNKLIQGIWEDSRYELSSFPKALKSAMKEGRHECPFAPELVIDLMQMWSYKEDTVFDPFGGMGTVAWAAIKMGDRGLGGRNTIISEMKGYHVNMAKQWAESLGLPQEKPA